MRYIVEPWIASMQGIAVLSFVVPLITGVFVGILIIIIKEKINNMKRRKMR